MPLIQRTTSSILIQKFHRIYRLLRITVVALPPLTKQPNSSCEVSNKTDTFWDVYEIKHREIKALGFSKLSIKTGYTLLKHSVDICEFFIM